jgi:hypothetical protein
MFTATHFRSEFVRQSQATILRKVTMTQFMLVIVTAAAGIGLLGAPYWLAPAFMALGYVAGHEHNGAILLRRGLALAVVWLRTAAGRPRLVNVQALWEGARTGGTPHPSGIPAAGGAAARSQLRRMNLFS